MKTLTGWKPATIGRTLRRFRVLRLIKPVAGTRKYYPTARGESLLIAGLQVTGPVIVPRARCLMIVENLFVVWERDTNPPYCGAVSFFR